MPSVRSRRARPGEARRTQAERRASTQARLLDATVDRLTHDGYAGMSTNDIVRRAGVSRGALVHHYPTKAHLAVAALDRWLENRLVEFEAEFTAVPPAQRDTALAIDVLWRMFQGPTFAAWLELTTAARTDLGLRNLLAPVNDRFNEGAAAAFDRAFPAAGGPTVESHLAVHFAFTVLTGAAVGRILEPPGAPNPPESLSTLKFIASAFVNDTRSPT
jgi:AcrR family transcriptional regulator